MCRKCAFCSSYHTYRLANGRVKCPSCGSGYGLKRLRRDPGILHYFALEISIDREDYPRYLKWMESRYNHRNTGVFKKMF